MATYGKKKLGIFSKSAEFLDDKSKAPGEDSPGNTRLGKFKSAFKTPWSRAGDKSVDGIAKDTLLGGPSYTGNASFSSEPAIPTGGSSVSTAPTNPDHFNPTMTPTTTFAEALNMSVPPVPQTHLSKLYKGRSRPIRKPKSRLRRKGDKEGVRPVISAPILQGPGPRMATRPILSDSILQGPRPPMITGPIVSDRIIQAPVPPMPTRPAPVPPMPTRLAPTLEDVGSPMGATLTIPTAVAQVPSPSQTHMLDNSDGSRRQGTTTTQVNTTDTQTTNHTLDTVTEQFRALQAAFNAQSRDADAEKTLRLSPLQRGKAMLAKAARGFAGRSSASNAANEDPPAGLDLHIAVGMNLANEKARSLVGDVHVKRKPVPAIKKNSEAEDPDHPEVMALKDAFLEFLLGSPTKEELARANVEFEFKMNALATRNSTHEGDVRRRHSGMSMAIATGSSQAEPGSPDAQANPHARSDEFAEMEPSISSSVGYSTPLAGSSTFRFDRNVSGLAQQLADVLTLESPSVDVSTPRVSVEHASNIGFENGGENVMPFIATPTGPITHENKSVKRRSAIFDKDDVGKSDEVKRIKRDSLEFRDRGSSASLTAGPERDLAISDVAKGKQPMTGEEVKRPQLQRRGAVHRRSAAISDVTKGRQPMTDEKVERPQLLQRRGAVHRRSAATSDVTKGRQPMTDEKVERPPLLQRRGAVHRRSAIPRPTGNLNRGGARARGAFDMKVNNPMGVDKLESSDTAYQVGKE